MTSVPEAGFDAPKAIARAQWLGTPIEIRSRAAYEQRNARANYILSSLATKYRARVVNIASIICPDVQCRISVNGVSLYRDDDHLSVFGAEWALPQLMKNGRAPLAAHK